MSSLPDLTVTPSEGEVVLFTDVWQMGDHQKYTIGDYTPLSTAMNDKVSSFSMGPHTKVQFYQNANFGGPTITFRNAGNSIFYKTLPYSTNFDNIITSMQVSSTVPLGASSDQGSGVKTTLIIISVLLILLAAGIYVAKKKTKGRI